MRARVIRSFALALALAMLGTGASCVADDDAIAPGHGSQAIYNGTYEPASQHPWVARSQGSRNNCGATVVHPRWVLTAAHCVDDDTEATVGAGRLSDGSYDQTRNARVHLHPGYTRDTHRHDLALLELDPPLELNRRVQTAGLPGAALAVGHSARIAALANLGDPLPPGSLAVADVTAVDCALAYADERVCVRDPEAALCNGDSGSGVIAMQTRDGWPRATLVAVASTGDWPTCDYGGGGGEISSAMDVQAYKPWILATMGMSEAAVRGRVRVRSTGSAVDGLVRVDCWPDGQSYAMHEGPMDVAGVEVGIDCPGDALVSTTCDINGEPRDRVIAGFERDGQPLGFLPFYAYWAVHSDAPVSTEARCFVGLPVPLIVAAL